MKKRSQNHGNRIIVTRQDVGRGLAPSYDQPAMMHNAATRNAKKATTNNPPRTHNEPGEKNLAPQLTLPPFTIGVQPATRIGAPIAKDSSDRSIKIWCLPVISV
ncbi:MAG: hypothetical protein V2B18_18155 [Pseudomonadota bacterium]